MSNAIGKLVTLEAGLQSANGTAAAPTVKLELLSTSGFSEKAEYKASEAMIGKRGAADKIVASKKLEGSFSTYANPGNIGILLASFFGAEADPVRVESSAAYKHAFTFAGVTDVLRPLTFALNKIVSDQSFQDCYIKDFTINITPGDYVKVDFNIVGKKEITGNTQSLSQPVITPYIYKHGTFKFDDTAVGYIQSAKITFENGLKTDRRAFTTDKTEREYFLEPTLGEAKVKYSFDAFYDASTEAIRTAKYKADSPISIEIELEHDTEIETGYPYKLVIASTNCAVDDFTSDVSGPDELTASITAEANNTDSDEPVTVTITDAQSTKYLA